MFCYTKDAEYGFQPAYLSVDIHLTSVYLVGKMLVLYLHNSKTDFYLTAIHLLLQNFDDLCCTHISLIILENALLLETLIINMIKTYFGYIIIKYFVFIS